MNNKNLWDKIDIEELGKEKLNHRKMHKDMIESCNKAIDLIDNYVETVSPLAEKLASTYVEINKVLEKRLSNSIKTYSSVNAGKVGDLLRSAHKSYVFHVQKMKTDEQFKDVKFSDGLYH